MTNPFGEVMQEIRNKEGLRVHDIASKLNVNEYYVRSMERSQRQVPADYIKALLENFLFDDTYTQKLRIASKLSALSEKERQTALMVMSVIHAKDSSKYESALMSTLEILLGDEVDGNPEFDTNDWVDFLFDVN